MEKKQTEVRAVENENQKSWVENFQCILLEKFDLIRIPCEQKKVGWREKSKYEWN